MSINIPKHTLLPGGDWDSCTEAIIKGRDLWEEEESTINDLIELIRTWVPEKFVGYCLSVIMSNQKQSTKYT